METKWTPGPWAVSAMEAVTAENERVVALCTPRLRARDTETANAHLIASAPDLYEALAALEHEYGPTTLRRAAAALSKARGEA